MKLLKRRKFVNRKKRILYLSLLFLLLFITVGYAYMRFKNSTLVSNLSCNNITDQFALGNNKATLIYPIGLISYEGGNGSETDPWIADE